MAARLNKRHQDMVREKIKTSQLLNRLTDYALGNKVTVKGGEEKEIEMTAPQVTAALGVLKKALPDLKATEHSGPDGGPIEHKALPWSFEESESEE